MAKRSVSAGVCGAMLLVGGLAQAVSPEQAGFYQGTYSVTKYGYGGAKTKAKIPIAIDLNQNNSVSVSFDGVQYQSTAQAGVNDAYIPLYETGHHGSVVVHFGKDSIKGTLHLGKSTEVLDGKFKMKK